MKALHTRIVGLVLLLTALTLAITACQGGSDTSGSGLVGSVKEETVLVANVTDSNSPYKIINDAIIEYMIVHGFHYHVEMVDITLDEVHQAIKEGTVLVAMEVPDTEDWLRDDHVTDYGVLFTAADGTEYHKVIDDKRLAPLTPDFAMSLKKMNVEARRYDQTLKWMEKYDVSDPEKIAVYFFWEFDYSTGSFKDWMEYDPWQDIRVHTQNTTRMIRGTEYKGKDLVKENKNYTR